MGGVSVKPGFSILHLILQLWAQIGRKKPGIETSWYDCLILASSWFSVASHLAPAQWRRKFFVPNWSSENICWHYDWMLSVITRAKVSWWLFGEAFTCFEMVTQNVFLCLPGSSTYPPTATNATYRLTTSNATYPLTTSNTTYLPTTSNAPTTTNATYPLTTINHQ